MNAKEQEQMFKDLRTAHPGWTKEFTSGYVHGVEDEGIRQKPAGSFIEGARQIDHYALGYLMGFAMHRGTDCEQEAWFGFVSLLVEEEKK
jgi:hypothetical protein